MDVNIQSSSEAVISDICSLRWDSLSREQLTAAAWAYYYFSVQFRESLTVALAYLPGDANLQTLKLGEIDTDNLSPWPGVANVGEAMDHDEFMRRLLHLDPIDPARQADLQRRGNAYLDLTRGLGRPARAMAIASYEAGGLERVFRAILTAPHWDGPVLQAFRHFLLQHIAFDSDPDAGHGALSRHLNPDDRITPLWTAFHDLLTGSVPALAHHTLH